MFPYTLELRSLNKVSFSYYFNTHRDVIQLERWKAKEKITNNEDGCMMELKAKKMKKD